MSSLGFRAMSLMFKVRDFLKPRGDVLSEAGIQPGFTVLDYGCGPGSYTLLAAGLVGPAGTVCALDIHPLAVEMVRKAASKKGLANVKTIRSDCATGLEDASVDVALLYDVFHGLDDGKAVLRELHRVLRPGGTLSFSDHHMKDSKIVSRISGTGQFELSRRGERTYTFARVG